jgi:hypothetical protein
VREIFYAENGMGKSAVEEFIDALDDRTQRKVLFVLGLAKDCGILPGQYFKKLSGSDGIWELRIQMAGQIYRILCFWGRRISIDARIQKEDPEDAEERN